MYGLEQFTQSGTSPETLVHEEQTNVPQRLQVFAAAVPGWWAHWVSGGACMETPWFQRVRQRRGALFSGTAGSDRCAAA